MCTENSIRVDHVSESPNLSGDDRAFCLCLALFVSPLKSKSRLEAENTALRHQAVSMEQTIIERRRCANRARYPLTETDMKMLSVILLIGSERPPGGGIFA